MTNKYARHEDDVRVERDITNQIMLIIFVRGLCVSFCRTRHHLTLLTPRLPIVQAVMGNVRNAILPRPPRHTGKRYMENVNTIECGTGATTPCCASATQARNDQAMRGWAVRSPAADSRPLLPRFSDRIHSSWYNSPTGARKIMQMRKVQMQYDFRIYT